MREQGELIVLMIQNEIRKNEAELHSIKNYRYFKPSKIEVKADEIVFISFISIQASSNFIFNYSSSTESRELKKTIVTPETIENNIVTKHLSNIKLSISNGDDYYVSVIKLKFIK